MTEIPIEIRSALAHVAAQITNAEADVAAAQSRVDSIIARIADADSADAELAEVAEADDGEALAQIAAGKSGSAALRQRVDRASMLRRAADAARRNLSGAETQLAAAQAVLDELLADRKELVGSALCAARSELEQKLADKIGELFLIAGHLAGAAEAAAEAGGAWKNLPDTGLFVGRQRTSNDGTFIPAGELDYLRIYAGADREVVAAAKASWLAIAESL